jgi:hypothetical protein
MMHLITFRPTLVSAIFRQLAVVFDVFILQDKHNIRTLSLNIEFNLHLLRNSIEKFAKCSLIYLFLKLVQINYSEHRKMRAKQQHVCKEMNQYMINANRKWILSFGIEWTIGVKYRI